MQKYIQSKEKFQGTLCFSGEAQVAQILNDKNIFNSVKNFRANSAFTASASCSKILNDKKYTFTVKNFRAKSVFLGKHKLLKNPECEKYIQ